MVDCTGNTKFKRPFPDIDYALLGYNVLKGYPLAAGHDPGFTHRVFKGDYRESRMTADCRYRYDLEGGGAKHGVKPEVSTCTRGEGVVFYVQTLSI